MIPPTESEHVLRTVEQLREAVERGTLELYLWLKYTVHGTRSLLAGHRLVEQRNQMAFTQQIIAGPSQAILSVGMRHLLNLVDGQTRIVDDVRGGIGQSVGKMYSFILFLYFL